MIVLSDSAGGRRHGFDWVLGWWREGMVAGGVLSLLILSACSGGGKYFHDAVDEATQEMVGKRYGSPHKVLASAHGGEVWTYFERGSGTASFSGQVRGEVCRAYLLTFDKETILRSWEQRTCQE